jgi:dihydrofolate synthase/folylpolyglutamate synthase
MNAAVAIAAVHALSGVIACTPATIHSGLTHVYWPGRLQLATLVSGQKFLLDGAHNLSGAESLAAALETYFPQSKPALILGILKDKDWTHMCQILAPLAGQVLLVPVHSERTAEPHGLAEVCRLANPRAEVTECASMREALARTAQRPFVTVAGSLYLIGEAMELLGLSATKSVEERSLNEWSVR